MFMTDGVNIRWKKGVGAYLLPSAQRKPMGPSSDKHNKINNSLKTLTSLLLKKCVASTDII